MQSRIVLNLTLAFGLLFAAEAPAQSSGSVETRLLIQCAEGDTSACIRYSLAQRLQIDENGDASFAPSGSTSRMTPERARAELGLDDTPQTPQETEAATPPASAPAPAPVPAETESTAQSAGVSTFWKWIAIVLLGFFAWIIYGVIRIGSREIKNEIKATPALKRPAVRKGARSSQGDLAAPPDPTHQIARWDTSEIMAWLDAQIEEIRPEVKDTEILALVDSKETFIGEEGSTRLKATRAAYGEDIYMSNTDAWKTPETRLSALTGARERIVGAAYAVGLMLWETAGADHATILSLFQLDSDAEFNPSSVNLHSYLSEKNLEPNDYMGRDVLEAHLRQAFDIGAPDGHYHIASQVLSYYLWTAPERPDEGYVAAALRRVEAYSKFDGRAFRDRIEAWPEAWDIEDKSVSTDGMMYEQRAAATGPMQ